MALGPSRQFQRGGLRDDRRRRLLMEEAQDRQDCSYSISTSSSSEDRPSPPPHYGDAAFMEEQKLLIDLIPRRLPGVGAVLLAGMGAIAALLGLHYWAASAAEHYPPGTFALLNVDVVGSLAQWFSCLLLLAAAAASLLIYSIRRQRNDDYHGHYRVWLWTALCWFLFATDVAVGLNRSLQQLIVHMTGTPLWKDGVLWWIIPYTLFFASLGSRIVMDMWPSRLSISAFVISAVCYLASLLAGLRVMPSGMIENAVMIHAGAIMLGHLMLLASMILQARYVVMDFEGLIPPTEKKPAKPKKIVLKKAAAEDDDSDEDDSNSGPWRRVDSPQGTPQPVLRRAATTPVFTPVDDDEDDDVPNPTNRKLTKQEKKALKERLIRERADREKKQSKW